MPGEQGPAGEGCKCEAIVVNTDYTVKEEDYYIGVNSNGPVTITLPLLTSSSTCSEYVIKAEMGPPLGNRKITVVPQGVAFIDGSNSYILQNPYESITIQGRGGNWFII